MTDFVQTVDCGSGKDLYIGASNNIFIKTVTINNAADAVEGKVTVKFPDFDAGLTDESKITTKEYSIGYAESISADDLTTKLKADTSLSEALTTVISVVQDIINEALVAGGAQSGAVTVTADHIKFLYFGSVEDWTTYDELPDNADAETKAAALAKALTSVEANGTAYITFDITDALGEAVQEAIANAGTTWAAYDSWALTGTLSWNANLTGAVKYVKSSNKYTTSEALSITTDYTVLATAIEVAGASTSGTKLTLARYDGTGVGGTKTGAAAMLTSNQLSEADALPSPNPLSFKADSTKGLMIKKDALKVGDLAAGTYRISVKWYSNSDEASKISEGKARKLEFTVGTTTDTQMVNLVGETGKTQGDMDDYVKTFTLTEAASVYIGASNEVYIKNIILEKASD